MRAPMPTLPKAVVIGHRTYRIRSWPPSKANRANGEGRIVFPRDLILVRTKNRSGPQQANTLLHEITHGIWHEIGLAPKDGEERIVFAMSNMMIATIRDNPEVFDWIAEKARS